MDQPKKNAIQLPNLREGLVVAFNDYDTDGHPQWLIHDSGRNKFFLIGWLEYEIYERWHLKNPEAIIESINNETTLHVEMSDIENFLLFLKRSYLLQLSGYEIHRQAKEQELFKTDNTISWLISNYLFFRIPLVKPDKFLTRTSYIGEFIFSRYMLYFMTFLGVIALYQLSIQWEQFTHTFPTVFTFQGVFFSMLAFLIGKCCHELGHAYMCKHYGVPVPTFGVAFLVFWPVMYTDTTLSWSLNNKQRLRIALAGIWVETYITIIAALIWCNTSNQLLSTICYVTITVNWVASLLINVSPFMRFDGYYVLADYLKMPNLQPRAFALTRWQIRRWLFGWSDPPPEKFTKHKHYFLVAYSLFTWLYRLSIYLGIAILVYHFFAKVVGILLFLVEIYYFILGPFVHEAQYWIACKDKFTLNLHTKITITVSSILFILFFLPISHTVEIPATLSYTHQFLFAPEAGILENNLPAVGTAIKANQPIAILNSVQLDQAILETELEYNKTFSQLRRAAVNPEFIEQKNVLLSDLKRLRAEYQKLLHTKERLVLKVPFDGVLVEKLQDVSPGTMVMKDQWLGDVIKPHSLLVEAFLPQIDANYVDVGASGDFYPSNYSVPSIPVTVTSIEIINAKQLGCSYSTQVKQPKGEDVVVETPCYNASDLGGEIPTYQTAEGLYVPANSVYRVILKTDADIQIHNVERGNVHIKTKSQSYASTVFYKFKTILIEELGF